MYQDFCDRCGSAIDPKTGQCPECARRGNRTAGIIAAVVLIAVVLAVTLFREPVVRGVTDLAHRVEALFSTRPEPEPDVVQAVEPAPDPRPEPDPARDEAVKAAQAYLETETYSPSALYLQLYGDGYQEADIDYALDHCGANWYENAAYCAMDWVASYYYSRVMLVEGLDEQRLHRGRSRIRRRLLRGQLVRGSHALRRVPAGGDPGAHRRGGFRRPAGIRLHRRGSPVCRGPASLTMPQPYNNLR